MKRLAVVPIIAIAIILLLPLTGAAIISPYGNEKPLAVLKVRADYIAPDMYNATATLYNASILMGNIPGDKLPKEGTLVSEGLVLEPLPGKEVAIYAGGKEVGRGNTDIAGRFSATVNLTALGAMDGGPFDDMGCVEITAQFKGDDRFGGTSASAGVYCITKSQELTTATEGMLDYLNEDSGRQSICILFFIFLGFLIAGLYAAGSNPLRLFDITTPRVPAARRKPEIRLSKRTDEYDRQKEDLKKLKSEIDESLKKKIDLLAKEIAKKEGGKLKNIRNELWDKANSILADFEGSLKKISNIGSVDASKRERVGFIEAYYTIGQMLISESSKRLGSGDPTTKSLVSAWGTGLNLDVLNYNTLPDIMKSVVAYADAKMALDMLTLVELKAAHSKGVVGHSVWSKIANMPIIGTPLFKTVSTVRKTTGLVKGVGSAVAGVYTSRKARLKLADAQRQREQLLKEIKTLKERELDEESRKQVEELQKRLLAKEAEMVDLAKSASGGTLPDVIKTLTESRKYAAAAASETVLAGTHMLYSEIEKKRWEQLENMREAYERNRQMDLKGAVDSLKSSAENIGTESARRAVSEATEAISHGNYEAAASILLEGIRKGIEERLDRERGELTAKGISERFEEVVKIARQEGVSSDVIREAGTIAKPGLEIIDPGLATRVETSGVPYPAGIDNEIDRVVYVAREIIAEDPVKYGVAPTTQDEQMRRMLELDPYLTEEVRDALKNEGYEKALQIYKKGLESEERIEETHNKFVTPSRYAERIEDVAGSPEMKQFLLHEREFMTLVDTLSTKGVLPEHMTLEEFGKYSVLYKEEMREVEEARRRGDAEAVIEHQRKLDEMRALKEKEDKVRQLCEYYAREMAEIDLRGQSIQKADYEARAGRLQARVLKSLEGIVGKDVTAEFMKAKANFEDPNSQLRKKFEKDYKEGGFIERARAEFRAAAAFNRATARAKQYNFEENLEKLANRTEWETAAVDELLARAIEFNRNRRVEILALNRSLGYLVGENDAGVESYEYDPAAGTYKTFKEAKKIAAERAQKNGQLIDNTEDIILGMEEKVAEVYRGAFKRFFKNVAEGKYKDKGFSGIAYRGYWQTRMVNGKEKVFIMGLDPDTDSPTQLKRLFDKSGFKALENELINEIAAELKAKGLLREGVDDAAVKGIAKSYLGFYDTLQKLDLIHPGLFLSYEAALSTSTWIQEAKANYMALPDKKVHYDTLGPADKLINYAVDAEGRVSGVTPSKWQRFYVELEKFGNSIIGGHQIGLMAETVFTGMLLGRHAQLTKMGGPGLAGTAEHRRLNRNAELADPLLDAYKWRVMLGKLDENSLKLVAEDIGPEKIVNGTLKAISKAKVRIRKEIDALEADKEAAAKRTYFDENVRNADLALIDSRISELKDELARLDQLSEHISKNHSRYVSREDREKDIAKVEEFIGKVREEVGEFLMGERLADMFAMSPRYAEEAMTHIGYAQQDLKLFKEMGEKVTQEINDACKTAISDANALRSLTSAIDAERDVHKKALLAINSLASRMRTLETEISQIEKQVASGAPPDTLKMLNAKRDAAVEELKRVAAAHEMLTTTVLEKAKGVSERIGWYNVRGRINNDILEACSATQLPDDVHDALVKSVSSIAKSDERASLALQRVEALISENETQLAEIEKKIKGAPGKYPKLEKEYGKIKAYLSGLYRLRDKIKPLLDEAREAEQKIISDKRGIGYQIHELNKRLLIEETIMGSSKFKSELLGKVLKEPFVAAFRMMRDSIVGPQPNRGRPRVFRLSDELNYYDARVLEYNKALSPMNEVISQHMRNYAFTLDKFLEILQMKYKTLEGRMHHRSVGAHLNVGPYSGFQFSGPLTTSMFQHLATYGRYGNSGWITAMILQYPVEVAIQRYKAFYPFLTSYLSDTPTMTSPMGRRATKRSL
ncbi:MAG: hypothetical protein N3H30_02405, partial [Candidatus Micrarchaeota archaeon]|nr:hypothetical protein [Candidatus Micrarchaeota archaeon]